MKISCDVEWKSQQKKFYVFTETSTRISVSMFQGNKDNCERSEAQKSVNTSAFCERIATSGGFFTKLFLCFMWFFFHFSVIQGPRTKIPCFICKRWALSTNTLEDLVTWSTKKSAKLIENCCEHPRCWLQHVYKPKLVRNEGRFLDDLETSRWIAGGFPALLTWSAMKNTPNYIVPMRTNRSDAANPLFFWWVKFRSSWREKRSEFWCIFWKKSFVIFFYVQFVSFSWWKKSWKPLAAGWADVSAKSRVEVSSSLYEAPFSITNEIHENHSRAWPIATWV